MSKFQLPMDAEFRAIARRVIWFESPEVALTDGTRFLAYALRFATPEDLQTIRSVVTDAQLLATLDHLPPGIVDERSWAYWNSKLGRWPPPSPPRRML